MPSECTNCGSTDLATRGSGAFRHLCKACYNTYQRQQYHANHDRSLEIRRSLYQKHAEKRRAEAADYKGKHRERYSLMEWFRRKGIPTAALENEELDALVEMKRALKESKQQTKNNR